MSMVKCPPAQRMPISGWCRSSKIAMSAITSVSPET